MQCFVSAEPRLRVASLRGGGRFLPLGVEQVLRPPILPLVLLQVRRFVQPLLPDRLPHWVPVPLVPMVLQVPLLLRVPMPVPLVLRVPMVLQVLLLLLVLMPLPLPKTLSHAPKS